MAQDLRDLFKEEHQRKYPMKPGHEIRFAKRLDQAMPRKRRWPYTTFAIAASLLVLVAIGTYTYQEFFGVKDIPTTVLEHGSGTSEAGGLSLGDLSPDLKKIEQYYVANINMELSELEVTGENKAMVDGFMERLATLNREYQQLNIELNTIGPNDQTINALINNLQLRLELLYKLRDKLDTLKSIDDDAEFSQNI